MSVERLQHQRRRAWNGHTWHSSARRRHCGDASAVQMHVAKWLTPTGFDCFTRECGDSSDLRLACTESSAPVTRRGVGVSAR